MIPFNYNFSTKEASNFVEKIKFVQVSWRALPELYSSVVKIQSINGNLFMVIPVEYLVDVTIMKYTVTNTGREFIALRGKIKGITPSAENFDNSELIGNTLFLSGPRF